MAKAMPAFMYKDPMEAAIRLEEPVCKGCIHKITLQERAFCGVGKRELKKCDRYKQEGGV